ncbi:class I SAM-dependent methyltransferase [Algoriphagus namhaensis]|uniref:Class I SAM-dependent methyltransferase n=1 Tax=Algoriphagus namhaensis TaxID=915353 RepID=A0ABV8AKM4_9BACT
MAAVYDKYYQTENLFGEPYPELIEFFAGYPRKGNVLDLGCGQGRDAISLARLGYDVTGIDNSLVGIDQMNRIAKTENLNLKGLVEDIYAFDNFKGFDFVLLDSMFHFTKKDKKKEVEFIQRIISGIQSECIVVICIQDSGSKIKVLNEAISQDIPLRRLIDRQFNYTFEDQETGFKSETAYRMIAWEKDSASV